MSRGLGDVYKRQGITKTVTNSYEYENADGVLISGSFSTPYEVTGIQ